MKTFISLFLSAAMIFLLVLPCQVKAQDDGSDPESRIQDIANIGWEGLAPVREILERRLKIKLTRENAWTTFKAALPETAKAIEATAIRRTGYEVVELSNGMVRITLWRKQAGGGGLGGALGPITRRLAPLAFVFLLINLNMEIDNWLEEMIVNELDRMDPDDISSREELQEIANEITDGMRVTIMAPNCVLQNAFGEACIGDLLNEIERVREKRPRPVHYRNQPGTPRYFPPAGHAPTDITSGFPCVPGSNNNGQPALPQSDPGSQGTSGSFDGGTITVTAADPCKS